MSIREYFQALSEGEHARLHEFLAVSHNDDGTLNGGSMPPLGTTLMGLGDSITINDVASSGVMPQAEIGPRCWTMWGSLLSQGRFTWQGVAATVGYTTAQILATHVPTIVAARPAVCTVLGGTNDINSSVPVATTIANLKAIYAALKAAQIVPIACTIPPITGSSTAQKTALSSMNSWIKRYAAANGWPCCDFYAQLVDPSTGEWTSGYNTDNYHPNSTGAKVMGQLLSDVLAGTSFLSLRQTGPWLPPIGPWLPGYNSDPANLQSNGLMLTASTGRPTGWSLTTGTPSSEACATDSTTFGNYYTLGGASPAPQLKTGGVTAASAGDWIYVCTRLGTSGVKTNGLSWSYNIASQDQTQDYINLVSWDQDVPKGSVLAYKFQISASDASNRQLRFKVFAPNGSGGSISIGQVAVLNLTTLGIV